MLTRGIVIYRSVVVEPGKFTQFTPERDIRLSLAALGEKIEDESSRSTIKLTYLKPMDVYSDDEDEEEEAEKSKDDEESPIVTTVLCSLSPGRVSITTDFEFVY